MKATEFLEALIGEQGAFEKQVGFDPEDFIEGKKVYTNSPVSIYGKSGIPSLVAGNVIERKRVSEFQRPASDTYAQALSGLF